MIDPVAFEIGSIPIHWYGIILAAGFLFGLWFSLKLCKYRDIKREDIYDLFVFLIIGGILGARIVHIFTEWNYYITDPIQMLYIWQGGIAFHGALLGGILVMLIFARMRKIHFYDLADVITVPFALTLAAGRIGNFINQEFYGRLTDLPWGMNFDNVEGKRHPSQVYESIKNLFIFVILYNLFKLKKIRRGNIFWIFIFLYSSLRFFVEFYKDLPALFLGMTWGQLVSIPLFVISIIFLYKINIRKSKVQ